MTGAGRAAGAADTGLPALRARLIAFAALLALCVACSACKRDTLPKRADAAELVEQLSGVWATSDNAGTDDAETVYLIDPQADGALRIVRDGEWVANTNEDVDPVAQTVVVRRETATGPEETLTFKAVREDGDAAESFHLRLTYGNGQVQVLGYVRRLSTGDRETIARALRKSSAIARDGEDAADPDAMLSAVAAMRDECANAISARMRAVCGSDELRRLHWAYREHFALLNKRFPSDARPVQLAAERQLEACADAACLRKAYADWGTYLGENYDLFDAY